MKLDEIRDNPGARKSRIRVGRGIGSGKGKTGGRGVKGQKSRTGVAVKGFEGGQMPLHRRLPKRGFHNIFRLDYNEVAIGRIQVEIDAGKINAAEPITVSVLVAAGVLRRPKDGVRVLGGGELKSAVTLEVAYATASVVSAVEAAGGKVIVLAPPTVAAEAV
ncbi:50S ribosomal protein L15 [Xanthobacter sediminis]|uniref:50S ribosomal protein L15 n=1 Tax=Xanthobacter sediminis TaxID=3119926 RepID=UPI00372CDD13